MKDVACLRILSGFKYEFHFRHCRHVQRQEYLYITGMNFHISTKYVTDLLPPTGVHFSLKLKETSNSSRSRIKTSSGKFEIADLPLKSYVIRLLPSRDFNIADVTEMGNRYARREMFTFCGFVWRSKERISFSDFKLYTWRRALESIWFFPSTMM